MSDSGVGYRAGLGLRGNPIGADPPTRRRPDNRACDKTESQLLRLVDSPVRERHNHDGRLVIDAHEAHAGRGLASTLTRPYSAICNACGGCRLLRDPRRCNRPDCDVVVIATERHVAKFGARVSIRWA